MLRFSALNKTPEPAEVNQAPAKPNEVHPLDALTGGAFSAPTSGERAARVREWLAGNPSPEQMQEVFKELSARDKGAARPLREKLDELRRAKGQEAIAAEWAEKGQALLALPKLNIADAMGWQRDAAKAGAPLSREPLSELKAKLADRVKTIEDLQHRTQVQREAAVLLAQRIEVLSTKPWKDAQGAWDVLRADVEHWQSQASDIAADANWASVDVKFPPLLDASKGQLLVVWEAFQGALSQAVAASEDASAPLPPVPVWADELRVARGQPAEAAAARPPRPAKPRIDPELRAKATTAVREALTKVEQEVAEGHGKASAGAAAALRNAMKEFGRLIDDKLENQANAALAAAGELEGWQRWRADQLREELVAKAEGLFERTTKDGQPLPEGEAPKPRMGGRKMQETLRTLREQWKQTDQGGVPNHALWKRFDEACNEAYKVVESWLEKVKAESAEHKAQRVALIEELKAWSADNQTAKDGDWKGFNRILHQFAERWRDSGHLSEKAFADLQPQWKAAISAAHAPLEAMQKESLQRRQAMIDEAVALGAAPMLRIDAVRQLQQHWQAEAQAVPLERRHEQKLWDAFRKPIDDAFNRKTQDREKAASQLSDRDRTVLEASKALEAANASGDARRIRDAMAALDAALRGQAQAAAVAAQAVTDEAAAKKASEASAPAPAAEEGAAAAEAPAEGEAAAAGEAAEGAEAAAPAAPAPAPKAPPKPVVAMRGDDRPGMKKSAPAPAGRGGKFGDRKGAPGGRGEPYREERGARPAYEDRGPRLGDAAFRAQRDALEHAQSTLRKLAAQAHGEALTQLLGAWEQRSVDQVPGQQELGKTVSPSVRGSWAQAIGKAPAGDAGEALLRLEMAAEVPTPAEHINARRAMQLQLLTRRNDPTPAQTWGQDAAKVLESPYEAGSAKRLQNVLKNLLKG
jgi:ATP-dependent RNA helicase SUPV3L1/SUV3